MIADIVFRMACAILLALLIVIAWQIKQPVQGLAIGAACGILTWRR
jgi:hypothetical protein